MKLLSFDLEIAKQLPDDVKDWADHRPFGITCAAVAWFTDADQYNVETQVYFDILNGDPDRPAPQMSQGLALELAHLLKYFVDQGFTLVTWNGLGFDFSVLAEECGDPVLCRELALAHIDPMFELFCRKGYPLGLDTAARGMGLGGKLEDLNGAMMPGLWAQGEHRKVLDYLRQDVTITLQLARDIVGLGGLAWRSRSGRRQNVGIKCLPASEAMLLPMPNTEWMAEPIPRAKFTAWLETPATAAPADVEF